MSMTWPERSTLRVIEASSKDPVPNLLVFVEALARRKNHFSVGPLVTNQNGEAVLSRVDILKAIAESTQESPMDYSGLISDCTGEIRITVDDRDSLRQRIARVKRFYPQEAARLRALAEDAANSEVQSLQITEPVSPEITVEVKRKTA